MDTQRRRLFNRRAYIHSDVDTLERMRILDDLRNGIYNVLIGVNLLREGLDLPQVSLVVILDADKEGFLRNHRSLTQTAGRAARNVNGKVIMYADKITDSMQRTIDETDRRRAKQMKYNLEHGIVPRQIVKKQTNELIELYENNHCSEKTQGKKGRKPQSPVTQPVHPGTSVPKQPRPYIEDEHEMGLVADPTVLYMTTEDMEIRIRKLKLDMTEAARRTDFIEAAQIRDELIKMQDLYDAIKSKEKETQIKGNENTRLN